MAKNMEMTFLFDFYGDMLTAKQRDMMELYYENDLSLSEIAENEGITRQGVRDSIKRAESQLLEMEERLGTQPVGGLFPRDRRAGRADRGPVAGACRRMIRK